MAHVDYYSCDACGCRFGPEDKGRHIKVEYLIYLDDFEMDLCRTCGDDARSYLSSLKKRQECIPL